MAGLDSIKHFDDGGEVGTSQGAIQATMDKSGKTSVAGKIALDPTQTEAILTNMQKYIDERSGGWNQFMGGINRAYATTYGPSAVTAYDQQKNQEDKQIMDYRTQMAAYRAAAKSGEQRDTAMAQTLSSLRGGAGGVGGAGSIGGLDQNILNRAEQLAKLGYRDEADKLLNTHLTDVGKANATASLTKDFNSPDIQIVDPEDPAGKRTIFVSVSQLKQMSASPKFTPQGLATLQQKNTSGATANLPETKVPLEGLPAPFYAKESSSGKADTSQVGVGGAKGPMQVTKATFDTYQNKGIIPKSYSFDDPNQLHAAGILILNDLHTKHGGDINKIAAEYHGGPGAINTDGSVNIARKDALGTSVGQYVNDIRSGMKLPPVNLSTAKAEMAAAPVPAAPVPAATSARPSIGISAEQKAAPKQAEADIETVKAGNVKEREHAADYITKIAELGGKADDVMKKADMVYNHASNNPNDFGWSKKSVTENVLSPVFAGAGALPYVGQDVQKGVEATVAPFMGKGVATRRDITDKIAGQLSFDFVAQTFAGSGARLGVGLEKMGQDVKGIGTQFSPEANMMNSAIIKVAYGKAKDQAEAWQKYHATHPTEHPYQFLQSAENKQVTAKWNNELDKLEGPLRKAYPEYFNDKTIGANSKTEEKPLAPHERAKQELERRKAAKGSQ